MFSAFLPFSQDISGTQAFRVLSESLPIHLLASVLIPTVLSTKILGTATSVSLCRLVAWLELSGYGALKDCRSKAKLP